MTEDNQNNSKNLINNFATILKDIEIDEDKINECAKTIIDSSNKMNESTLSKT